MEPILGKIVDLTDEIVTVEVLGENILADFALYDLIVPAGEKLELGYVINIDEVNGKPRFVIQGGFWTKEDIEKVNEAGRLMADALRMLWD